MRFCTGIGYDVHRFTKTEGKKLILGGVIIPHSHGLEGHSDADVLTHAIADALLGALGEPDIGYWFPPGDPQWKNMDSLLILEKARDLTKEKNATIQNIDATLITEAPKILPHLKEIKESIAKTLQLPTDYIGVKATTNETMGAIGRKEGIAAMSVASICYT